MLMRSRWRLPLTTPPGELPPTGTLNTTSRFFAGWLTAFS